MPSCSLTQRTSLTSLLQHRRRSQRPRPHSPQSNRQRHNLHVHHRLPLQPRTSDLHGRPPRTSPKPQRPTSKPPLPLTNPIQPLTLLNPTGSPTLLQCHGPHPSNTVHPLRLRSNEPSRHPRHPSWLPHHLRLCSRRPTPLFPPLASGLQALPDTHCRGVVICRPRDYC